VDTASGDVRLAEVAGAISLAGDLGFGQPLETGLRVALLGLALADRMELDAEERRRVLYLALARHIGCTANSDEVAAIAMDEIALRAPTPRLDLADRGVMLPHVVRHVSALAPLHRRPAALLRLLAGLDAIMKASAAVCEAAATLAARLGLPAETVSDIPLFFERWDGKGFRGTAEGETLPRPDRIVQVAEAAEAFDRVDGAEIARDMLRRRSGSVFAPDAVEAFLADAPELLRVLETEDAWTAVLSAEPQPWLRLDTAGLDRACAVIADFADLRSAYLGGHSRGVAELAADAAGLAGCPPGDVVAIRRAGLVHDVGRVAVSAGVWGKPGRLTSTEREAVRLHPYYTERVLARPNVLAAIGRMGSLHHERLDGSGYFRGCRGADQPLAARLLAAADALRAMREPRPHRPALDAGAAASELRADVHTGRLDGDAVEAVLAASGEAGARRRRGAGELTPREIEVLRLLARGASKPEIARRLVIAPKTADAHTQHIYAKLGVTTRAGAALYAMRHGLLDPLAE
jgi:HD-GYP domain-containing protein (c-di-GMP phosphodiesterase class II)